MLNFLLPILSWVFVLEDKSVALNECLGQGYLNFLSSKSQFCNDENIFCWIWLSLISILMSDIIDIYFVYHCIKEINKSTEESRNMLSKQAYRNRKRYELYREFFLYKSKWCGIWQYRLWSFQAGGTKLERFLHKNQHTQRKLLNFEFWINGELSKIGHHFSM